MPARSLRQRKAVQRSPSPQSSSISTSRPRRAAAQAAVAATASALDRETETPDEPRVPPTRLKIAPSKLRQSETANTITVGGRGSKGARESFEGGEIVVGSRARKKAIVEESSEEEDEEDELAEDGEDVDDQDEDDEDEEEEEDEDGEGEDDEEIEPDEDVDMDDLPPARPRPVAQVKAGGASGVRTKPSITLTPAKGASVPLASVEDKEMAMGSDDEEDEEEEEEADDLSDLDSMEGGEEDAEGEVAEDEEMLDEEDAEGDSDDDDGRTPGGSGSMSRSNTPDPTKLTRRQRGEDEGALLALSNEAQKKKHLTAEEHQARRAEMARRRKNLSEKRNEEEKVRDAIPLSRDTVTPSDRVVRKTTRTELTHYFEQMDTINRLLKKQAPKRRTRKEIEAEEAAEAEEYAQENPPSIYIRWTTTIDGSTVSAPQEYLDADNVNSVFSGGVTRGQPSPFRGVMVEEIEAS